MPPPSASKMSRGPSAYSSQSGGPGSIARRASMARSPPPPPVVPVAESMRRQLSAGASSVAESLLSEEPLEAEGEGGEQAEDDLWEGEQPLDEPAPQEKEDPFSLRATDTRKIAEPVR